MIDWQQNPPESGEFAFVRHDRKNGTMAFRLGRRIYYFGEDPISDTGRTLDEMPDSTEYSHIESP